MYLSAVTEFYNAIDAVFFMFVDFYKTNITVNEVNSWLNMEEMSSGNVSINNSNVYPISEIEFKNVTFTYPGQTTPTLNNVSLKMSKGSKIMLREVVY